MDGIRQPQVLVFVSSWSFELTFCAAFLFGLLGLVSLFGRTVFRLFDYAYAA